MRRLASIFCCVLIYTNLQASDWPQWRGPNRDNAWNEPGIMETFPVGGLKVLWRAPAGRGYATPVVAQGRVFITFSEYGKTDVHETIDCLDEKTGASLWRHRYLAPYDEDSKDCGP